MKELLLKIIVCLRSKQMFYQHAHNLVARAPFGADHELLGGFYEECGDHYDAAVERFIGLLGEEGLELPLILSQVQQYLQGAPGASTTENKAFFQFGLKLELELCQHVKQLCSLPESSEGLKQLVGDFCDKGEVRQYKIKRRIK